MNDILTSKTITLANHETGARVIWRAEARPAALPGCNSSSSEGDTPEEALRVLRKHYMNQEFYRIKNFCRELSELMAKEKLGKGTYPGKIEFEIRKAYNVENDLFGWDYVAVSLKLSISQLRKCLQQSAGMSMHEDPFCLIWEACPPAAIFTRLAHAVKGKMIKDHLPYQLNRPHPEGVLR